MKQGTLITRIVIVVLFLAVVAYLGFTVWQGITSPYQTVVSYAYEMNDGANLEGLVVRQEEVIGGETALSEVLPQEGERVAVGAAVAAVYSNEQALREHRRAQSLELQLEQLQYAMRRNDSVEDVSKLDRELVETMARMRTHVSSGSLSSLADEGLALRSLVLKRTGSAGSASESLASIQEAAARLEDQLGQARKAAEGKTRYIRVKKSGVFSGMTDGYEGMITPDNLSSMSARDLKSLMERRVSAPAGTVGKLITGSTWYYVTTVNETTAQRLTVGKRYAISFAGDFREEVSMRLDRLGDLEEGRRIAVFSADRSLEKVTLARRVSATLVFQKFTGVRVPTKALRVLDNEDGTTTLGVYTLVGRQAEFKPVEIVREGDGFYLLRGTSQNRRVLRAGDVIVLSNQELYNGKVVA